MISMKKVRGKEFRECVNASIANDDIEYKKLKGDRWVAIMNMVHYYERDGRNFGPYIQSVSQYELNFIPNKIEYNGSFVTNMGYKCPVDWKTYCWAVRKISEYQIMQKLDMNNDA